MKTLYYGGTIRTMEADGTAEALLVENGVIAAVGRLAGREIATAAEAREILGITRNWQ